MKKKAPVSKKENLIQYCIDAHLVDDVLPLIKHVTIIGCGVRFGMPIKRQKTIVPVKLRKCGVNRMSEIKAGLEAEITLDQTTPTSIKRSVKTVANHLGVDPKVASFRYLTLADKQGSGRFEVTTKEMQPQKEGEAIDLRRKARVLGLTNGTGKVNSLCSKIGAGKFRCDIETVKESKIVLCRRV